MSDAPRLFPDRDHAVAVQEAHDIIERTVAEHRPEAVFLLTSGGNDSLVLLDVVAEHADAVVHINTGIGIEDTNRFALSVGATYSDTVMEYRPPIAYEDLVFDQWNGLPGPGAHRFTFTMLKERCVEQLLRDHGLRRGRRLRFLLLSGARKAESRRRMGHGQVVRRKGGQVWVNPIFTWSNAEMANHRQTRNLPVNEVAANLHMSGECLCGAMADQGPGREERALIRFFYPDFDQRLCDLEEECRSRGLRYCEWGVKRPGWKKDRGGPLCESCAWRTLPFEEGGNGESRA